MVMFWSFQPKDPLWIFFRNFAPFYIFASLLTFPQKLDILKFHCAKFAFDWGREFRGASFLNILYVSNFSIELFKF